MLSRKRRSVAERSKPIGPPNTRRTVFCSQRFSRLSGTAAEERSGVPVGKVTSSVSRGASREGPPVGTGGHGGEAGRLEQPSRAVVRDQAAHRPDVLRLRAEDLRQS